MKAVIVDLYRYWGYRRVYRFLKQSGEMDRIEHMWGRPTTPDNPLPFSVWRGSELDPRVYMTAQER
jgi:hypothetical protein